MQSASEHPFNRLGIRTSLSGFSAFAVSAMNRTATNTITSAVVAFASLLSWYESPVKSPTPQVISGCT